MAIGALLACSFAIFAQGHAPGRILVKFNPSSLGHQRQQALDIVRGKVSREIAEVSVVELRSAGQEEAMARAIANSPFVEFAEIDRRKSVSSAFVPNDPWYTNWQSQLRDIDCPGGWTISLGSPDVVIAILDTGVDLTHPDLVPNLVPGWDIVRNKPDSGDVYGHGTLVAGVASASGNNGIGVASVAMNCKIMPIRVADDLGYAYISDIADGLVWAADHGAKVANVSIDCSDDRTVSNAAKYIFNKGGVCVVSAGNEGVYRNQPDDPYELAVGAVDMYKNLVSYSCTGPYVDLVARDSCFTTLRGGSYGIAGGTSISAPMVAGTAALIFSINPSISPQFVIDLIKSGCVDLGPTGPDTTFGSGLLSVNNALVPMAQPSPDTTPPIVGFQSPSDGSSLTGGVNVVIDCTDDTSVPVVSLYVDGLFVGAKSSSPYQWQLDSRNLTNGIHQFSVVATDSSGNIAHAAISVAVSNTEPDTEAPTVYILNPADGSTAGSRVDVKIVHSDNVGVVGSALYVDGVAVGTNKTFYRVSTRKWSRGAHAIQAQVVDAAGNVGWSQIIYVYK